MTKIIIRFVGFLCLVVGSPTAAFSAVAFVQARNVPSENIEKFVHRETTYWSEVARQAIKDGKLQRWELWQRVGGINLAGQHNFVFRNVVGSWEDVDNMNSIWDAAKVFPKVKPAEMDTFSLGTVTDSLYFEIVDAVVKTPPKFIRVNFARSRDINHYIELEHTIWKPYIEDRMSNGGTNVVSWGLSRLAIPGGVDRPYGAITVDGFEKLSDALNPNLGDYSEVPEIEGLFDVHEKAAVQVYELVMAVAGDE